MSNLSLAVMAVIFVLGFFLDTFEIIFIVVPIAAPALLKLGVDPVWLGVMIGMNLQASFLTPPFGFALFYLRGVAGKFVRTVDIYRGVVTYVRVVDGKLNPREKIKMMSTGATHELLEVGIVSPDPKASDGLGVGEVG